jgi:hypothetical protein
MRRRALAVAATITCTAIFLVGKAAPNTGGADDALAKVVGIEQFGLTKVWNRRIEVPAEEQ